MYGYYSILPASIGYGRFLRNLSKLYSRNIHVTLLEKSVVNQSWIQALKVT